MFYAGHGYLLGPPHDKRNHRWGGHRALNQNPRWSSNSPLRDLRDCRTVTRVLPICRPCGHTRKTTAPTAKSSTRRGTQVRGDETWTPWRSQSRTAENCVALHINASRIPRSLDDGRIPATFSLGLNSSASTRFARLQSAGGLVEAGKNSRLETARALGAPDFLKVSRGAAWTRTDFLGVFHGKPKLDGVNRPSLAGVLRLDTQ